MTTDITDLSSRPIWQDLSGEDAEGPYLVGGRCADCGDLSIGLREICPECWSERRMLRTPMGRQGVLYSYTVLSAVPPGFDGPFAVGYIDIESDIRVFAHAGASPNDLSIGQMLRLTLAPLRKSKDGVWLVGPRYQVAGESPA